MGFLDGAGLKRFWDKLSARLDKKQNTLTPDESITLQDGAISVATPVKAVTQAQYSSLAQADKDSETVWLVTDIDDAPSGSESTQNVYSAEETIVGTWLNSDGRQKPVYRRRFDFYTDSRLNAWWQIPDSIIPDLENLVQLSATIYDKNHPGVIARIPYFASTKEFVSMVYYSLYGIRFYNAEENYAGAEATAIIEYTKTTD